MDDMIRDKMEAIELVVRYTNLSNSFRELRGIYRTVQYSVVSKDGQCHYTISQHGIVVAKCTTQEAELPTPNDVEAVIEAHINHH